MKKAFIVFSILIPLLVLRGQDSLTKKTPPTTQYILHFYPSTLLYADLTFGFEHLMKNKFAQELSVNYKHAPPAFIFYDRGFRVDYFFKYDVFKRKKFRFSPLLSLSYKNIYFKDKNIDYYAFKYSKNLQDNLYQTLREDRRRVEYGCGLGASLNFRIHKRFSFGTDLVVNVVKLREIYSFKEIIYRVQLNYYDPYELVVPSTKVIERWILSPLLRLKLSYSFASF